MASEIAEAIKHVCDEKGIPLNVVVETVEAALAAAYRKDFGQPNQNVRVKFDMETGQSRVFDVKTVVEDTLKEEWEKAVEEARKRQEEGLPPPSLEASASANASADKSEGEKEKLRYHPRLHLTFTEAKEKKPDATVGEEIITELEVPSTYGRMAAQTAKQVIIQKLREAERGILFEEFKGKEGDVVRGTIQRRLGPNFLVDLGRLAAILPPEEQVERERYISGSRFKFFIRSVAMGTKGPEVIVSRAHIGLVKKLFTIEIPEIANGSVEIMDVAREGGSRTKIAVRSLAENVDPIGSCVGQRGSRVQTVIGELGGEKIDIIEWHENPEMFIQHALSPAKVSSVSLDQEKKKATVAVKDDQLSLAIGKGGQNVRLAAQLTGWDIDIRGEGGSEGGAPETVVEEAPAEKQPASEVLEEKKDEEKKEEETTV